VARPPEVFVRPLPMEEGRKIQRITRTTKNAIKARRAIVVLRSAQGRGALDITHLLQVSDDFVRAGVQLRIGMVAFSLFAADECVTPAIS